MLKHVQKMWRQYARLKGFGLFSSMLALAVLSLIVLLIAEQVSEYDFRQRQKTVALDLARLTDAATDHVVRNFKSFDPEGELPGEITQLMVSELDTLPASFPKDEEQNQVGQKYRMYIHRFAVRKLDILVTTETPPPPKSYNHAALNNYKGHGHIGIIREVDDPDDPDDPDYLVGPGLKADITPYSAAFAQRPFLGETAVITHLTAREVLGDLMYRKAQPGHDDATKMETDLDLGDHTLVAVNDIAAKTLTIDAQLKVLGGVNVIGDLMVGTHVSGEARASGAGRSTLTVIGTTTVTTLKVPTATFNTARIKETLTSAAAEITSDLTVMGILTAESAEFSGKVTAPTLEAHTLNAGTLNSLHIKVTDTATIKDLVAKRLIVQDFSVTGQPSNPPED